MRYCLNCNQIAKSQKIMPIGNKIIGDIIDGLFFIVFLGFVTTSISPFSYGLDRFHLIGFICLVCFAVIGAAYCTHPKPCSVYESINWKIAKYTYFLNINCIKQSLVQQYLKAVIHV